MTIDLDYDALHCLLGKGSSCCSSDCPVRMGAIRDPRIEFNIPPSL